MEWMSWYVTYPSVQLGVKDGNGSGGCEDIRNVTKSRVAADVCSVS